jgi:hypothetical protein
MWNIFQSWAYVNNPINETTQLQLKLDTQSSVEQVECGTMLRMSNDTSTVYGKKLNIERSAIQPFVSFYKWKGVKTLQMKLKYPFFWSLKERLIIAVCRREIIHWMLLCMFIQSKFKRKILSILSRRKNSDTFTDLSDESIFEKDFLVWWIN